MGKVSRLCDRGCNRRVIILARLNVALELRLRVEDDADHNQDGRSAKRLEERVARHGQDDGRDDGNESDEDGCGQRRVERDVMHER